MNFKKIKLSTWNVNGFRACYKKGFVEYLKESKPNILCLQEIKATKEQTIELMEDIEKNYHCYFHSAKKAGYSGVMTLIDKKLIQEWENNIQVSNGIEEEIFDNEGRMQVITTPHFLLLAGYYPNGQRDHSRVDYKLNFSERILSRAYELSQRSKLPVFLCGDFNTAHREIDLKNPKTNMNSTGFLPHERAFIDKMINKGFFDLFREKYPNTVDAYTWWTYRGDCRDRNIGWRLDYFFANEKGKNMLINVNHRTEITGSDHCPVEIIIEI